MFGAADATRAGAMKVPPKPISGRWGRTGQCERHLLSGDPHQLVAVLTAVLKKDVEAQDAKDTAKMAAKGKGKKNELDELKEESMQEHSDKMGRWALDSMYVLNQSPFMIVVAFSERIRSKLDAMLWCMQKVRPDNSPQNLALMTWGKAESLRDKLATLTKRAAWSDMFTSLLSSLPTQERRRVEASIIRIVYRLVGNFDRRIVGTVSTLPVSLLWMAWANQSMRASNASNSARW